MNRVLVFRERSRLRRRRFSRDRHRRIVHLYGLRSTNAVAIQMMTCHKAAFCWTHSSSTGSRDSDGVLMSLSGFWLAFFYLEETRVRVMTASPEDCDGVVAWVILVL